MKRVLVSLTVAAGLVFTGCMSINQSMVSEINPKDKAQSFAIEKDATSLEVKETAVFEKELTKKLLKGGFLTESADKLVVKYKVVSYDPGSRFARWMAGIFGAGKAVLKMQVSYTSKDKEQAVTVTDIVMKGGSLGGSTESVFEEAGSKVAEYIIKNLKK